MVYLLYQHFGLHLNKKNFQEFSTWFTTVHPAIPIPMFFTPTKTALSTTVTPWGAWSPSQAPPRLRMLKRTWCLGGKTPQKNAATLPETNRKAHENPHGFLVNTIKMVDFPWRTVSFREGNCFSFKGVWKCKNGKTLELICKNWCYLLFGADTSWNGLRCNSCPVTFSSETFKLGDAYPFSLWFSLVVKYDEWERINIDFEWVI